MPQELTSYVAGRWHKGTESPQRLTDASTEEVLATVGSGGIDFGEVLAYAHKKGGPALRAMSFAARGEMLQAASKAIHAYREELLDISAANAGTTRGDGKFDIDGATATLSAYGYVGKKLGDRTFLSDGDGIQLGRTARWWGQHVYVPRLGAAVHINAFNFPAWNMLEKAACAWLAGVPVIEKPGTPTAMVAWRIAQILTESGVLPEGAFQMVVGSTGDLLDRLRAQDGVAFTGSSWTARKLRATPAIIEHAVRFNGEADSLNSAILGPDLDEGDESWRLFIRNVALDMRQKTGQKCTAVRRILVPTDRMAAVREALVGELSGIVAGDPRADGTTMGPLASENQLKSVREGIDRFAGSLTTVMGGSAPVHDKGWFVAPTLFEAANADVDVVHEHEVFGPVATLLPYDGSPEEAARLVARGDGSLVTSLYTDDATWMERAVLGLAPWNGRVWIGTAKCAEQTMPPGTVLANMIHGGPGRAGGGEELGGERGLLFYMQSTAVQCFKGHLDPAFGRPGEVTTA